MKGGAMSGYAQRAQTFWNERNPRERGMLAAAIAVVVLGLVYALLLDPALSGREQLQQQLPSLRQQAAEVRALTREAGTSGVRSTPVAAVTRDGLTASLSRRGLSAQELTISGNIVRLRFETASFSALVEWLAEAHRTSRLMVSEAKVEAGEEADRVNAALTLSQERGQDQ